MKSEKTCKCGDNCCKKNEPGFYMAVIDVDTKYGTINNMKDYDTTRYFNEKFVDTPEMALMVAVDIDSKRWKVYDRVDVESIMRDVTYDPKNNEYIVKNVYTSNWNEPTENQYKKFIAGEYKFYVQTFYIQILRTDLVCGDRRTGAVNTWIKKLEML